MKIAVCLKYVPSTTALIRPNDDGVSLALGEVEHILSPYDEYALEEALKTKEKIKGSTVSAVTVGTSVAGKILTQAFSVGADEATLIEAENLDARAAAVCISSLFSSAKPDLIFCGRQAIDDDAWIFPATLAELLDYPHVTAVNSFELSEDGSAAICKRNVEGGLETIEVKTPAVISCDKGLNKLRMPTLKGRMAAKKKKPEVKAAGDLVSDASQLAPAFAIQSLSPPPPKSPGQVIEKPAEEAAADLIAWLKSEVKVL